MTSNLINTDRLVASVAKKLNLVDGVSFSHWIPSTTGDIPVFFVPETHGDLARELGLTVSTYD